MEYVTLELNTNYTIRCEADEPLSWRLASDSLNYDVQTFNTGDPQRPHGSMLYLLDISTMNLGNYYCIKKSSIPNSVEDMMDEELVELVNNNTASSIYVYVNGKNKCTEELHVIFTNAIILRQTPIIFYHKMNFRSLVRFSTRIRSYHANQLCPI